MKITRVTAALLAGIALAGTAVSCTKKDGGKETESAVTESVTVVGDQTPKAVYDKLISEAEKFNGRTFTILFGGNLANDDYIFDEDSDERVESAQYRRRAKLEEDLGIKVNPIEKTFWPQCFGNGPFHDEVAAVVLGGGMDYDLIYGGIYECASLTTSGHLSSLSRTPHVDLSGSWYDQDAIKSLAINGDVFFINGDFSITDDDYTHCILFNKKIADDNGITTAAIYDHVRNRTWTVDRLGTYVKDMYKDLNGNSVPDYGDQFGLLTWNDSCPAMVAACGTRIATLNKDGEAELTMKNEKVLSMLSKYFSYAYDSSVAINYQTLSGLGFDNETARDNIFTNDLAFFAQSMICYVRQYRGMLSEFGILPYPTYDESQKDFYTYATLSVMNAVCIPLDVRSRELTGAFLEAASILGQIIVVPEYYEETLERKVARDDESKEMLDIIFSSKVYDVGMFYNIGSMYSNLLSMFADKKNTYVVLEAAYRGQMNTRLDEINSSIADLIASYK